MISKDQKDQINALLDTDLSKDQIREKVNSEYQLQEDRTQARYWVERLAQCFMKNLSKWVYDEILWDVNAMIDRTQELMKKEYLENQKAQEENLENSEV